MSQAKWKFIGHVLLGTLWIGLCVWKLIVDVIEGFTRGFGAEVVVTSRHGTSHYPVWGWLLILGVCLGFGVRYIYYKWLDYDED